MANVSDESQRPARRFRFRFGLRTLLLLMVVVAIALWGHRLWTRSTRYAALAREYAMQEEIHSQRWMDRPMAPFAPEGEEPWTQQERVAYFRRLRLKYEDAARRPWIDVDGEDDGFVWLVPPST